ncbi:MAG: carboxylating nicotinate-nucleotide diphosphorylase [Bacteroidota bacterium]
MIEYKQITELPENYINEKIEEFLREDFAYEDITTLACVPDNKTIRGYIESQSELVFCGNQIIRKILSNCNVLQINYQDGKLLPRNTIIATFIGNARYILSRERVLLNIVQRLSGVATITRQFADKAKKYNIKILDTRKTTPGLRLFEKYAVYCGGGTNHRLNLKEGMLIKDNHITASGSITQALLNAKSMDLGLPIELEVDNIEQIKEAMQVGVDGFLLDNMNREQTIEAVKLIRSYPNGEQIFIESSGGINLSNIDNYFETGINAISIGALTHSAKSVDIHMEFEFE